jgi:hypothetical protein
VRANEQVGLTALHTLFMREHNRLCVKIKKDHPDLSGEEIYQRARAYVGALMQVITYREFLPLLIGRYALRPYWGYNKRVNPGIINEFSTAAYRFGHSMLSPTLMCIKKNGEPAQGCPLPLRDAFFAPDTFKKIGLDALLRGLVTQKPQEVDVHLVDDVRNFLFGPPGAGGFDLASLNMQRGRDHGPPTYNTVLKMFGYSKVRK